MSPPLLNNPDLSHRRRCRTFLTFAEHGARAFATVSSGPLGDFESPFEAAVAERLRARGWVVHPQIGVSGFRVDLGVVDPDAPGAFIAGVECDGATYHRSASARDRDRLRQAVLENLGWRVLRIWPTDWWTNAQRETDRIHISLVGLLEAKRAARVADRGEIADRGQDAATGNVGGEVTGVDDSAAEDGGTDGAAEQGSAPPAAPSLTVPSEALVGLDPARFYEDDYRDRLATLVEAFLTAEGPIRDEALAQRVARAHGFQRTGRRIRDAVYAVLPRGTAMTKEGDAVFYWPPGVAPNSWNIRRDPPAGDYRDPAEVAMEELCVLARCISAKGLSEEEAVVAMRDALGMARMREGARQRCLAA